MYLELAVVLDQGPEARQKSTSMDRGERRAARNQRRRLLREDRRREDPADARGNRDVPAHVHFKDWAVGNKNGQELTEVEQDEVNISKLQGLVDPREFLSYDVPEHLLNQPREIQQINRGLKTIFNTMALSRREYLFWVSKNRPHCAEANAAMDKIVECEKEIPIYQAQVTSLKGRCFATPPIFLTFPVLLK